MIRCHISHHFLGDQSGQDMAVMTKLSRFVWLISVSWFDWCDLAMLLIRPG